MYYTISGASGTATKILAEKRMQKTEPKTFYDNRSGPTIIKSLVANRLFGIVSLSHSQVVGTEAINYTSTVSMAMLSGGGLFLKRVSQKKENEKTTTHPYREV